MTTSLRVAACLAATIICAPLCHGEGRLEGTVHDGSAAVVPGASILCTGAETGFRFQAESGIDGKYALIVPSGHYDLIVRRLGFRTIARIGVLVPDAGAVQVDFELTPGSIWETVTVSDVPDADVWRSSGAVVIHPEAVRTLPANDRTVTGLLYLAPGVLFTPASRGDPGQFSSLGARPNSNTVSVDGVSGNNAVAGAGWPSLMPGGKLPSMTALGTTHNLAVLDSIQEVTVELQGDTIGFSQAPGAEIIIHTRPGTNALHGSLFGGTRPRALGASDWFANRYSLGHDAPALDQEGGTLGGPLRRDRTFAFVSAERLAIRQGYAWTTTVPSRAARLISPTDLRAYLNEFPLPNGPDLALGSAQLIGVRRQPGALTAASVRLDHQVSPASRVFLRVSDSPSFADSGATQTNHTEYRNLTAVLGVTRTFARWIHDSRLGFSRNEATSTWSLPTGGELPPAPFYAQYPSLAADFTNVVVGGAASVSVGQNGRNLQNQWQFSQTAALETSRHQSRFGVTYLELRPERIGPASSLTVAFGTPTDLINGPLAPVWVTSSAPEANSTLLRRVAAFAQDTWRIHSRLNVTFGLRASRAPAPNIIPAANLYRVDGPVADAVTPIQHREPLWQGPAVQLDPSMATAWRLAEHSVLRASWSLVHDGESAAATDQMNGIPRQQLQTAPSGVVQPYVFSNLIPVDLGYGFARNLRLPTYQRWSLRLQHQWRKDAVEFSYAGLHGEQELRRQLVLGPAAAPEVGALISAADNGISQYHGLTAAYRRTLSSGLQASATYSWSHSIDLNSSDSAVFLVTKTHGAPTDRGSSDFDVRHVLNAGVTYSRSGWTFGALVFARSGFPVNVQMSETLKGFAVANNQAGLIAGAPVWVSVPAAPGGRMLNAPPPQKNGGAPLAFAYPVDGIQPIGRNAIEGFGAWQADVAVEHPVWDRGALHVSGRIDAFNALNHAAFADPARFWSNPMFGQSQSPQNLMFGQGSPGGGQAPAFLVGAPRSLQMSLRLSF